jgi:hypothetical protein
MMGAVIATAATAESATGATAAVLGTAGEALEVGIAVGEAETVVEVEEMVAGVEINLAIPTMYARCKSRPLHLRPVSQTSPLSV